MPTLNAANNSNFKPPQLCSMRPAEFPVTPQFDPEDKHRRILRILLLARRAALTRLKFEIRRYQQCKILPVRQYKLCRFLTNVILTWNMRAAFFVFLAFISYAVSAVTRVFGDFANNLANDLWRRESLKCAFDGCW
jgi:hypothetical protein